MGRSSSPAKAPLPPPPPPSARAVAAQRPLLLLLVLFVVSLQAVSVLYALEVSSLKESPLGVAIVGAVAIGGIGGLALCGFRACGCTLSLTAAFFAMTCWSAAVDLVLALALIGATDLGRFYVVTGEEYFKSSWGVGALFWDGTVHYVLQLFLAHATLLEQPHFYVGLAWCGSIINSLPVLLLGGASGVYSGVIKPSTALNVPYVFVPLAYLHHLLSTAAPVGGADCPEVASKKVLGTRRAAGSGHAAKGQAAASVGAGHGECTPRRAAALEATAWAALHVAAIVLHAWRALIALGSRSASALWWREHVDPVRTSQGDDAGEG